MEECLACNWEVTGSILDLAGFFYNFHVVSQCSVGFFLFLLASAIHVTLHAALCCATFRSWKCFYHCPKVCPCYFCHAQDLHNWQWRVECLQADTEKGSMEGCQPWALRGAAAGRWQTFLIGTGRRLFLGPLSLLLNPAHPNNICLICETSSPKGSPDSSVRDISVITEIFFWNIVMGELSPANRKGVEHSAPTYTDHFHLGNVRWKRYKVIKIKCEMKIKTVILEKNGLVSEKYILETKENKIQGEPKQH